MPQSHEATVQATDLDSLPSANTGKNYVASDRFLNIGQVIERVGFRRTRLYEMIKVGMFPAPIKVGRLSRWSERDIHAWIEETKLASAAERAAKVA